MGVPLEWIESMRSDGEICTTSVTGRHHFRK